MFDIFRRRQKTLLAVLTLLAMAAFAFPISYFGPGDDRSGKQGREVVTTINGRSVTRDMLEAARREKELANAFVRNAILAVGDFSLANLDPRLIDEFLGFGSTQTNEDIEDSMRMAAKADDYGIKITDEMVSDFIRERSRGRLTNEQYQGIVNGLGRYYAGLTGDTLFEILRRQMRIRRVAELATGTIGGGSTQVTPFEAWQFYRKLHDRVTLEVVPVKVSDFAAEIADPGDTELRQLFDKYVSRLPDLNSSEPGFKEPRKVRVQYATESLDAFLLALRGEIQVTEAEMQQYYENNKYKYMIPPTPPDDAEPAEVPPKPTMDQPKPEEPKSDEPKKDEAKGDEAQKEDAKPDAPAGKDSSAPKKEKLDEPNLTEPAKPDAPKQDKPDEVDSCEECDDNAQNKSTDEPVEPKTPQAKSEPDRQKSETSATGDQKSEDAKPAPEAKTDQETKPGETSDSEQTKKDKPDQPVSPKDEPKYKPFDEVKEEIAEKLARQKARDELLKRMKKVQALINQFADDEYLPLKVEFDKKKEKDKKKELVFVSPQPPDFTKEIEALGLKFGDTNLIGFDDELPKVEGLGEAFELVGDTASRRGVRIVFGGDRRGDSHDPILYDPIELVNSQDQFFTAWKVADVAEREPTFDEVRDKVLAAYHMIQAREPARKRAEKLMESLRAAAGDVSKVIASEPGLESRTVPSVPLWSDTSIFGRGRVEPSVLPGIELPGDELRDLVFSMKQDEIKVAPNLTHDTYYVIVMTKREPASMESYHRSRMMVEMQVRDQLNQEQRMRWIADLREQSSPGKKVKTPAGN